MHFRNRQKLSSAIDLQQKLNLIYNEPQREFLRDKVDPQFASIFAIEKVIQNQKTSPIRIRLVSKYLNSLTEPAKQININNNADTLTTAAQIRCADCMLSQIDIRSKWKRI